jgi:hypothetical protein
LAYGADGVRVVRKNVIRAIRWALIRNAEIGEQRADWILIVSARFLPIGRTLWIRVDLETDRTVFGQVQWRRSEDSEISSAALEVDEQVALRKLVRKLQQALSDGENVLGEPTFVYDGSPCHLRVLGRAPQPMLTYDLNIAGYRAKDDLATVPELCKRLLGLKEALR